jgi:hypothetical protein
VLVCVSVLLRRVSGTDAAFSQMTGMGFLLICTTVFFWTWLWRRYVSLRCREKGHDLTRTCLRR